jgi:hypothetical protein
MMRLIRMLPIALAAVALLSSPIRAQKAGSPEISVFAGYQTIGTVTVASGSLNIIDSWNYNIALDIPVGNKPGLLVELNTSFMPTQLEYKGSDYYGSPYSEQIISDIDVWYFMVGGLHEVGNDEKVRPFGGVTVGASWFSPSNPKLTSDGSRYDLDDLWLFTLGLQMGARIFVNEKMAVRLQARALLPMDFTGTTFYMGTGGSGFALNSWVIFPQIDITAGLAFRLGN